MSNAIASGSKLGPYEILAPLGSGAMGEVWRARDPRLGRDVAIKVLPEAFAADAERLARFRREAQVLAALNHTNIAAIHGLEESRGVEALVLELVEGETLAEQLAAGPLPVDDALRVAREIAEGLEAAHERGIVHRDLKPANVKLTPQGQVKILDFGLAKALEAERPAPDQSHSPTVTAGTAAGVILGTAAYMSPEQARGRAVDERADIWAFGAVIYEMLTGRRAFGGESVSDTLAAVLTKDPDWSALPADTPASVRRTLRHCLARDPRTRFHHIADARIEMDDEPGGRAAAVPEPRRVSRALPWLAAGLALIAAGAGWWRALRQPTATPGRVSRLAVAVSETDRIPYDDLPVFDLSSDGRKVVYISDRGEGRRLFLRSVDQIESKAIAGTDKALSPFFSPDARWVGFFADGKLKKVPADGGVPVALCDAAAPRGAVWLSDDTIVFSPDFTSGLRRVAARGGQPAVLTNPDTGKGERTHRWPAVLPGGSLLFTIGTLENPDNFDDARLALFDPKTGKIRTLLENATMGRYVAGGRLVCYRAGSLAAVGFDAARGELKGEPVRLPEPVGGDRSSGIAFFALAADGTLAYLSASFGLDNRSLVLVDRNGAPTTLPLPSRPYHTPRFSPDGKRLAVTIGSGRGNDDDIWMCDIGSGSLTRLTLGNLGAHAVWSPDGKRVAFATSRDQQTVYSRNADGSGSEESLGKSGHPYIPSDWSLDGRTLAVTRGFPNTDVWLLTVEGKKEERPFQTAAYGAVFSPDGRWIAYTASAAGGIDQVLVRPASGSGGALQVTSEGGTSPAWAGRELFFARGGKILVLETSTEPSFQAGPARVLFEAPFELETAPLRNYDVSRDGRRFVFVRGVSDSRWREIHLDLNWADELARLSPISAK
jgi:serine/threonine-protein kinase